MMGQSNGQCLVFIDPDVAAAPRRRPLGAPRRGEHPAGAAAARSPGCSRGGAAAAVYALHCTEDSPLFYAVWYGLAILAATGVGALLGARPVALVGGRSRGWTCAAASGTDRA